MDRNIIERYFDDTCSPEERAQVERWLSDHGEKEAAMVEIERLWKEFQWSDENQQYAELGKDEMPPRFEAVWDHMQAGDSQPTKLRRAGRFQEKWLYVAAACAGFLLTLGVLLWNPHRNAVQSSDEYVTVQTGMGERKRVTLSDGSEVFLNADTRLTYPRSMDIHQAAIYIEGEAFFNMKESETPRIIKAGGLETWAGERSKFNISAFPSDSTVTVAVDEGKTEIRNGEGPLLKLRMARPDTPDAPVDSVMPLMKLRPAVVMNKRELAVVHKERGELNVSASINDRKAFGWKDGILYFDAANPSEWISKLERWYGVNVDVCEAGLPTSEYSGEFQNAEIGNVLATLSQSLSFRYEIVGRTVFLCGK